MCFQLQIIVLFVNPLYLGVQRLENQRWTERLSWESDHLKEEFLNEHEQGI